MWALNRSLMSSPPFSLTDPVCGSRDVQSLLPLILLLLLLLLHGLNIHASPRIETRVCLSRGEDGGDEEEQDPRERE